MAGSASFGMPMAARAILLERRMKGTGRPKCDGYSVRSWDGRRPRADMPSTHAQVGRPVIDRTALFAKWDFFITYAPNGLTGSVSAVTCEVTGDTRSGLRAR